MSKKSNSLVRLKLSAYNRPIDVILYWDKEKAIDLNPPYQRGHVWGKTRQRNLIRSLLLGIPIPSIIINDRASAGWSDTLSCVVIDGKQRITSILKFLKGELDVPGEWFGFDKEITFLDLPKPEQRAFRGLAIPFAEGTLDSLDKEQEVFELVNYGGVPQGRSD